MFPALVIILTEKIYLSVIHSFIQTNQMETLNIKSYLENHRSRLNIFGDGDVIVILLELRSVVVLVNDVHGHVGRRR